MKNNLLKNILRHCSLFVVCCSLFIGNTFAASVVASVNGTLITDADITARVRLMTLQGQTATNNRKVALNNIIDDAVKIAYAESFKSVPDDKIVDAELKKMDLSGLSSTEKEVARSAIRANIAWQMIIGRTIIPTIEVSAEDIAAERKGLEVEHGLPIEVTMVRLIDVPENIKLSSPKSCDDAVKIAEDLGGAPQKFSAKEYELSADIRERISGLGILVWSPRKDNSILLVCSRKKTEEYGKLDEVIKENATYKKAMFAADQQLKQLRRKAVIVINDKNYK